jgi:hypothetical protein
MLDGLRPIKEVMGRISVRGCTIAWHNMSDYDLAPTVPITHRRTDTNAHIESGN